MFIKIYYKLRELFGDKDELHAHFRRHPQGKWVIGFDDWRRLEKIVLTYKPKLILDLGTGIGGSVACMARVNPEAKIVTVEQFEKCVKIAQDLIPQELQQRIDFIRTDAVVLAPPPEIPYQCFSVFKELPRGEWDMVVIDGPGPWRENEKMVKLPNGDFLKIIPAMKSGGLIYLDGRREVREIINRFYTKYFDTLDVGQCSHGYSERYTLWRRNALPFAGLQDAFKEKMQKYGYFD